MVVSKAGFLPASCPFVAAGDAVQSCTGGTATISASPSRIRPGQTTTLTYAASGVNTFCTISGPGVSRIVDANSCTVPSGTVSTPAINTQSTYTISCDGGTVTQQAIVNVVPYFKEF